MAKAIKNQALDRGLSAVYKDNSNDQKSGDDKNADNVIGSMVELNLGRFEVNPFQPRSSSKEEMLRRPA